MTHYLSILAIFKNEAHIFQEWIEHYLQEGVEHFFLIDNGSDDNFLETLQPYTGKISLWERRDRHAQVRLYNETFGAVRHLTQWIIPVDLDEFIYARHGS